jgi:putative protein kinase ArgK-like GTPase of G3E family
MAGHDESVVQVLSCSALEKANIKEIANSIFNDLDELKKSGKLESNRKHQNISWFKRLVDELLTKSLFSNKDVAKIYDELSEQVGESKANPLESAEKVIKKFLS